MRILAVTALAAALAASPARARDPRLKPLPRAEAASTHGPYSAGACNACHERPSPADPGRPLKTSNDLCFGCHDDFAASAPVRMDRRLHPVSKEPCTGCHNPHNARKPKLLL